MENKKLRHDDAEEKELDQQIEVIKQKQFVLRQEKGSDKLHRAANFFLKIFAVGLVIGGVGIFLLGPTSGMVETVLRTLLGANTYIAFGSTLAFLACEIPDVINTNRRYKKEQALKKELAVLREKRNQLAWKRNNQVTRANQIKKTSSSQATYIPEEPTIKKTAYQKVKTKNF